MKANLFSSSIVRTLVRQVYIFTYPLVRNYSIMIKQAIDKTSPECAGGFGVMKHASPAVQSASFANAPADAASFSYAWLDLRGEPWVLTLPVKAGEKYTSARISDLWSLIADFPGTMPGDSESCIIAPHDWPGGGFYSRKREYHENGSLILRCGSRFACCRIRAQRFDGERIDDARGARNRYRVESLSGHLGQTPPRGAVMPGWLPFTTGDDAVPGVFRYAAFLLRYTIPHPLDGPMYRKMDSLGVSPGLCWETDALRPETWRAVQAGIDDALEDIRLHSLKAAPFSRFFSNLKDRSIYYYLDRAVTMRQEQLHTPAEHAARGVYPCNFKRRAQ